MKIWTMLLGVGTGCVLLSGCLEPSGSRRTEAPPPPGAFVQGRTVIVPPLKNIEIGPGLDDGGTRVCHLTDARGTTIDFYIDHRVFSQTIGDIYLYAYPSDRKSMHVVNQSEFRTKMGIPAER